ncbi:MAG: DNA-directed RNA polymerase subunit omega [Eubacterium sp.]|nr:DNA-directed RNA polymerase subunit omega [Eubacterium sp.]
MIHPSYVEMIDKINADNVDREEAPLITSRYSIVLATAKRARQLVSGVEPYVDPYDKYGNPRKPLSVAVDEFYEDKVHIVNQHTAAKEEAIAEDAAGTDADSDVETAENMAEAEEAAETEE